LSAGLERDPFRLNRHPSESWDLTSPSRSSIHQIPQVQPLRIALLDQLDFPASLDEDLADLCFGYLADPKTPIAIRCASMTVLEKICQRVPELKSELQLLLEEYMDHSSAGFKSRAKRVLARLAKM